MAVAIAADMCAVLALVAVVAAHDGSLVLTGLRSTGISKPFSTRLRASPCTDMDRRSRRPAPNASHSTPAACSLLVSSSLRRCSLARLAAILASRSACLSARRRQASLLQGTNDLLSDHIASSVDGSAAHASSKDWAARPNAPQPCATYAGRWQMAPASALRLITASG